MPSKELQCARIDRVSEHVFLLSVSPWAGVYSALGGVLQSALGPATLLLHVLGFR